MATQTATRRGAKPTAPAEAEIVTVEVTEPTTWEIEVGRSGQHLLDQLANARVSRLLAERAEKPLKAKVKDLWDEAASDLGDDEVLLVKAMGVVRGRVTIRSRAKAVDLDLLMQAFPEAYAACVSDVKSPQFDPC